ncbi:apolipoprotein D-like [Belonocnema kinseyi]|uniref:apolipoprotein D-like n=1 Tax=Belonocnema kinseyi TaxID=2817044 RepID=UPI00143DC26A|nr:apolipoprotein D-like [Belonocnema kinseyi]
MFLVGFILLLCDGAFSQLPGFGACPDVEVVQDFNMTMYLGEWFEIQKYVSFSELLEKCVTASYSKNEDHSTKVIYKQMNVLTSKQTTIEAWSNFVDTPQIGKFYVDIPGQKLAEHFLLDTDYHNYAVVFTCNDIALLNAVSVWIWARQRKPSVAVLEKAYKVLDKYNLSRSALIKTDQKKCPNESKKHL